MPQLNTAKNTWVRLLRDAGIDSSEAEVNILLREVAQVSVVQEFTTPNIQISPAVADRISAIIARRVKHEPLQYILGTAPFRDLELKVTPDVLIPRPETELLVDLALKNLPRNGKLVDVGTGSGAIAISVAYEREDAHVTALDLSDSALAVAQENADKYHLRQRIKFLRSNLLSAVNGEKFDVICANLPYVTEMEYPTLDSEVRDFEPRLALVAADDGLALIFQLAEMLPTALAPNGCAIFELSPPQAEPLLKKLSNLSFSGKIVSDLTGRQRFVVAKKCFSD